MSVSSKLVLIMAGGAGTRFWPASRAAEPKQFLDILGTGKSLLQQTYERCARITTPERIFVLTNVDYRQRVLEELPELSAEQVFAEPARNNTAPAIAYATLKLQTRYPDAVCLVAPSDHIIANTEVFLETVQVAMEYAETHERLVTLGMTPTRPDTGYGYIRYDTKGEDHGVFPVLRFTEKPDTPTAEKFISSGGYLWNSGMFIWSVQAVLNAFDKHAAGITDLLRPGQEVFFTDKEEAFLSGKYPQTEKISIDYAILERAPNVSVIPASFGWSDLGTWKSLYDHLPANGAGNIEIHQPVVLDQCHGTLVRTTNNKLVVASGLEDMIIVNENDVVLIFPKDKEQEVKRIREILKEHGLERFL